MLHLLAKSRLVVLVEEVREDRAQGPDLPGDLGERRERSEVPARLTHHQELPGHVREGHLPQGFRHGRREGLLAEHRQPCAHRLFVDDTVRLGHRHVDDRFDLCTLDLGQGRPGRDVQAGGGAGATRQLDVEVHNGDGDRDRGCRQHPKPLASHRARPDERDPQSSVHVAHHPFRAPPRLDRNRCLRTKM